MVDKTINIALENIRKYVNELEKMGHGEVAAKLMAIYNEGMYKGNLVKFNLVYRDKNGDIIKICNEKYIYEYFRDDLNHYRKRTEIDGGNPFEYPPELVEENKALSDLQQMEYYRPVFYVK